MDDHPIDRQNHAQVSTISVRQYITKSCHHSIDGSLWMALASGGAVDHIGSHDRLARRKTCHRGASPCRRCASKSCGRAHASRPSLAAFVGHIVNRLGKARGGKEWRLCHDIMHNGALTPFHSSLAWSQEPLTGCPAPSTQPAVVGLPYVSAQGRQEGQPRGSVEPSAGGTALHVRRTPVSRAPRSPNGSARPVLLTNPPYARSKVSESDHAGCTGQLPLPSSTGMVQRGSSRLEAAEKRCIRPKSRYFVYSANHSAD
eukprot:SAG22_NODE_8_length_37215_cov_120.960351_18_plen_258_part_00